MKLQIWKHFQKTMRMSIFVASPKLYRELTTAQVLVMEYIDGYSVSDTHTLEQEGYDLVEIGEKLADNYVRQIMQDGFFHADPHPGNLRIRGGKIVWLDMGMMGRLTPRDKSLIAKAVKAIARGNNSELVDVILALGIFHGKPNRIRLYTDIEGLMTRYGTMDIGSIDIAALLTELIEIMSANELAMPAQLTLLARGMTTIEGVIADLSPQVNIVEVASGRISASFWENVNWKEELKNEGSQLYRSINRAMDIPVIMADLLQSYRNNETRIKLDLHATEDLSQMLEKLVSKMVMGLVIAALLLASRKIVEASEWTKTLKGQPDMDKLVESGKKKFAGPEITGKKLGVLGLGAIGVLVANAALALGMEVIGYDPYLSVQSAWHISGQVELAKSIEEVVSQSDYVTIHTPLNDSTKGMVNAELLKKFKKGARLINIARGGLVDPVAVAEALDNGILAKYVADFAAEELLGKENVIILPHLGASTPESEENCAEMAVDQLMNYLENGNIVNSVNYPNCDLGEASGAARITVHHKNLPNMIGQLTAILAADGHNISNMLNKSKGEWAYSMFDMEKKAPTEETIKKMEQIDGVVRVRVL